MKDLFKLILGVLTLLFKSRAKLAEILILRQRSMCFAGGHRNDGTSTIPIVFCLFGLVPLRPCRDCDCQAGDHHSQAPRWVSSVLALAIAQPCWQTEGLA
jgi:hypothetical protein